MSAVANSMTFADAQQRFSNRVAGRLDVDLGFGGITQYRDQA
jgi:hypothetical protein